MGNVTLNTIASSGGYDILLMGATAAATSVPQGLRPKSIPFAIPRGQRYYWSSQWQADEVEALQELARGEYVEFDDAAGLIRWLLGPED